MQPQDQELWQELRDALAVPQAANLKRLCTLLDSAIAQLPELHQLEAAGKAIEQMAEIYALRSKMLISGWENSGCLPDNALPVVELEAFEMWIRQSMSIDLDDLVEQPELKQTDRRQMPNSNNSVILPAETEAIVPMAEQTEVEEGNQLVRQLAGEEDPTRWSAAIEQWLQAHTDGQFVRLIDFYQELGMPLVEVWIGLLLGGFKLEQHGEFYQLSDIWVCSRCLV